MLNHGQSIPASRRENRTMMMRRFLPAVLLLLSTALAHAGKPVPDDLLKGLQDKEPAVRIKAIKGLSKLGVEAVPPLVKALRDEEIRVRNAAAYALGLLRAEPKDLVKALGPHLKDAAVAVRTGVTMALRKGGSAAVPLLQTALADKEADVRRQAVLSLEVIVAKTPATGKEILPALLKALGDPSPALRIDLARTLSRCGPEALAPMLTLAGDKDARARAYALAGLGRLKPMPDKVLPVLAKRVKEDPEVMVRQSALLTLGKLGKAAVPTVSAALADKEAAVQKAAVRALVAIGEEAKTAVPALKDTATKAENPDVRATAVAALGKMGKEGEEALLGVLGRDDSVTRLACLQYLGKQGKAPKSAVPDLVKALTDKDAEVRMLSAHVLGLIGPDAKAALPALEKAGKDEDERVSAIAQKAIKKIKGSTSQHP
jgi:HEAT repeat protein